MMRGMIRVGHYKWRTKILSGLCYSAIRNQKCTVGIDSEHNV